MYTYVPTNGKRSLLTPIVLLMIAFGALGLAAACDSAPDNPPANPVRANAVSASVVPDTANAILGDESHFDPIAVYPAIAKYAGNDLQLSSIHIYYVRSDGT